MEGANGMTTQQIDRDLAEKVIRVKIVEAAEPIPISCDSYVDCGDHWIRIDAGHRNPRRWSPSTSRDDCAEVLGRLTEGQRWAFVDVLNVVVLETELDGDNPMDWLLVTATPAQIALSVWRATCQ